MNDFFLNDCLNGCISQVLYRAIFNALLQYISLCLAPVSKIALLYRAIKLPLLRYYQATLFFTPKACSKQCSAQFVQGPASLNCTIFGHFPSTMCRATKRFQNQTRNIFCCYKLGRRKRIFCRKKNSMETGNMIDA